MELIGIAGCNIGIKLFEIRIGILADRPAAAAKVQHRRRRDRDLRRARRDRFQKLEIGALNRFRVPHFAGDVHDGRLEIDFAFRAVELDVNAALRLDALELRQEIDVKVGAPEFAVGDAAQSQIFLEFDDAADRFILHGAELGRIEQEFGAQEAADMVGAKGRRSARPQCRLTGGRFHTRILTAVQPRRDVMPACVSPSIFLHHDGWSGPWKPAS